MCPVNFPHIGAHPWLPGARSLPLYKLNFVTVCPARNALMVFGLTSPSTIHFVLVHHPSPCPLRLLLPMLPKESGVCKKITRACFNSRPSKGTIREQSCDWRQSDSTGKMLTFLRKFSEVCRRVL